MQLKYLDKDKKDEIFKLVKSGVSTKEIAFKFKMSLPTLYKLLAAEGIVLVRKKKELDYTVKRSIFYKFFQDGESIPKIAKSLNVSERQTRLIIKKNYKKIVDLGFNNFISSVNVFEW